MPLAWMAEAVNPPGDLQQDHGLMRLLNPTSGRYDQDQLIRDKIQTLLTRMTLVEEEMMAFNACIVAQNAFDQPLNLWPKYAGYNNLAAASERLEESISIVKTLIQNARFTKCCIKMHIVQARGISVRVSNATVSVMKIMCEKTKEYASCVEAETYGLKDQDDAGAIIAIELAEVIKHSTAAAKSVWAAVDLFEMIASASLSKKGEKSNEARSNLAWTCCAIVTLLSCFALFKGYNIPSSHGVPKPLGLNNATADMKPLISDMTSVCSLVHKNLHVAAQVQDATQVELNRRLQTIERALESSNERIDNVWEALGPPNAQGTYFSPDSISGERPGELQANLRKQLEKMKADALEFKRQVQRSEVRLSSRVNKLERKRRN